MPKLSIRTLLFLLTLQAVFLVGQALAFPNPPNNVQASDGDTNTITVTWSAPIGGDPVAQYLVYRTSPDNTPCGGSPITAVAAGQTQFVDTSFPNTNTFYYSLRAVSASNQNSNCSLSDGGNASQLPPPGSPDPVVASDTRFDKVVVNWTLPSNSQPIDTLRLYRTTNAGFKFCDGDLIASSLPGNTTSYDDLSATVNVGYFYALKAVGPTGISNCSAIPDEGRFITPPPPNPPTNVQATDGTFFDKIGVTWVPPTAGGTVTNYKLHRSTSNATGCNQLHIDNIPAANSALDDTTNVIPGIQYYYWMQAIGPDGTSECSMLDPGHAKVPAPAVSSTDGTFEDKVASTITPPTPNDAVTGYRLYRSTTPAQCQTLIQDNLPITPLLVDDLTAVPGVQYYYSVKAIAPTGDSDCSVVDPGHAQITAPVVSATDGSFPDKVVATWDPIPGGQPVTGYKLYRGLNPTDECVDLVATNLPVSPRSFDDTTAVPGVQYYYSLKASSATGDSDCSPVDPGHAKIPAPVVSATDGTHPDKVVATWPAPPVNQPITGYRLYRSEDMNSACQTLLADNLPATPRSFDDLSATPGVQYYYTLKAIADTGDSDCSLIDPGHARPEAPAVVATDGTFPDKVVVTLTPPTNAPEVLSYKLYRSPTPLACQTLIEPALPITPLSYDDTNVTPGVQYYYSLKAVTPTGDSECSPIDLGFALTECSDTIDNDGDGFNNLNDPGCTGPEDDDENDPRFVCDDGLDNDTDGKIDFQANGSGDPGCESPTDPDETDVTICNDGLDNDSDGKIDFPADPGCDSLEDNNENDTPICSDGLDNDGDGNIDFPADSGCDSPTDDDEKDPDTVCDDGIDNDRDGFIDFRADGKGDPGCESPEDPSEDNTGLALRSPAFAKFNTFLGQWNFAELVNQGDQDKEVELVVYNLRGEVMITRTIVVPGESEIDVDVNSLVQFACDVLKQGCVGFDDLSATRGENNGLGRPDGIVDTYGLVSFVFDDTDPDQQILGRISMYRPNGDGTFSFAFAREFRNPIKGVASYAMANTHDPRGLGNLVPNWAEVIALGKRNSKGEFVRRDLSFTLNLYDQQGNRIDTRTFTLPGLGEYDYAAGHEFLDINGNVIESVYLVEVIPSSPDAEYFLSVARYSSNSPAGFDPETYNYGLVLDGKTGTAENLFAPIGNAIKGIDGSNANNYVSNWVETGCISRTGCTARVTYRDDSGAVIDSQVQTYFSKAQVHFHAGVLLPKGSAGTIEIEVLKGRLFGQSMSYIHGELNELQSGFASVARSKGRAGQAGSINTFLGMQNALTVFGTTDDSINASVNVRDFNGSNFSSSVRVSSGGASSLGISSSGALAIPDNTFGALMLDTPADGQALAEVRRVKLRDKGEVDFVIPTLVK